VSLNEVDSEVLEEVGPRAAFLGVVHEHDGMLSGMPMMWDDPITENPAVGATEVWEIANFTMDAHPIHIHQVAFEVVDREPGHFADMDGGMGGMGGMGRMGMSRRAVRAHGGAMLPEGPRPPEPNEAGRKDTVIAYPGEVTRVKATFDLPGRFVWHCHIVEHEDNEMMRPFRVGP
jgi:FtsP/CotA-like multicopper oxidase with cupredoxin domain